MTAVSLFASKKIYRISLQFASERRKDAQLATTYFIRQERKCSFHGRLHEATKSNIFKLSFQKVDLDGLRLENTFVGKSKDSLDPVAPDLVAADVIQTFGPFVKYYVEQMTSPS